MYPSKTALCTMRYEEEVTQYKGQEPLKLDSVSFVKVQENITCKRANMYVKTKYQNKARQQQDKDIN